MTAPVGRPTGEDKHLYATTPLPVMPKRYGVTMRPQIPQELLDRAAEWDDLHRWERSELGKALRRLGLTYGEIRELIPVPKGTLSYWCREIQLTPAQIVAIYERSSPSSRAGIPSIRNGDGGKRSTRSDKRQPPSPRSTSTIRSSSRVSFSIGEKAPRQGIPLR